MTQTLYVTTTIPYVNAPPHTGHALELVQADAIARYARLVGRQVRFQTGTDENAFKNVLTAQALGVPVETLVDDNAERFAALCDALNLSHDRFLRTTEPAHRRAVEAVLERLRPGDLYATEYRGLYCAGCEDFYLERDLVGGCCPDHRTPAVAVEERNHFFRLSAYQEQLRELIASRRLRIVPEARESEVLRFIERGLDDVSISRDAARSAGWGIPFPGDPDQVVYVWIDALINYLSGLGFPGDARVDEFWNDTTTKLHVIGKNVWKFHAIYWPALLLSVGLPIPDTIVVHGFLTSEGVKISKSSGTAADPADYVREFGPDAVRYFLLRHVRPFDDTDFSVARLAAARDADLADGLGNLCSRLTALAERADLGRTGEARVPQAPPGFHEQVEAFRFDRALDALWDVVARLNRAIGDVRPWEDIKAGRTERAREHISAWIEDLDAVAYWIAPFLPGTSTTIREALTGEPIRRCAPLFPKSLVRPTTEQSSR